MPARALRRWAWPVRSIRQRLMLALLVPMALILFGSAPFDYRVASAPSEHAYDEMLLNEAMALVDQVRVVAGRPSLDLDHQAEGLLRADAVDTEYFAVYDGAGRLLAGDQALLPVPATRADRDDRDAPSFHDTTLGGTEVRVRMVALSRVVDGVPVVAQVAETLHKRDAARRRIVVAMILPNLLFALVVTAVLYAAARLSLAPLEQLAHEVTQRTGNDLRPLALDEPPSELAGVLAALNRLFGRVQRVTQAQQRFHANVAHQLRTPLTGLRTQIELAEMEGAFAGNDERRQRIDQALDQLGHLIDQLLSLARAEAGAQQAGVAFEGVDLMHLVEQRATRYVDQALQRGIDLGFQLEPTRPVRGSAVLLGEVVSNLVDNALRHCPAGSVVTVACGSDADGPWLAVEDDGPGIAPAQRDQVFARFYRAETAVAEGSGLGLAIVHEIAQLHGAQVRVLTPASGRGVRFEWRWPSPTRPSPTGPGVDNGPAGGVPSLPPPRKHLQP